MEENEEVNEKEGERDDEEEDEEEDESSLRQLPFQLFQAQTGSSMPVVPPSISSANFLDWQTRAPYCSPTSIWDSFFPWSSPRSHPYPPPR